MKSSETISVLLGVFLGLSAMAIGLNSCHRGYENPQAWQIIKQRTNESFRLDNYGFTTETGMRILGFTNKASAVAAMKEARWHSRNPPKPKKPEYWYEVVK